MKKNFVLLFIMICFILKTKTESLNTEKDIELLQLTQLSFNAPRDLGSIDVLYFDGKFVIMQDGNLNAVKNYNICSNLRNISLEDFKKFLYEHDGYVVVGKKSDSDFTLEARFRLCGGGVWGARVGAFLGRAVTYGVGYGTIYVISLATGPAAPVTRETLNKLCGPYIHAASNIASIAGGIYGGTLTGLV